MKLNSSLFLAALDIAAVDYSTRTYFHAKRHGGNWGSGMDDAG